MFGVATISATLCACASAPIDRQPVQSESHQAAGHVQDAPAGTMGMGAEMAPQQKMGMDPGNEVPHPFLTHMGVPDPVGVYSLRLGATVTRDDGDTDGDASFHLETGLTDTIGFHLRNDGVVNEQHTEAMFQFVGWRSEDKMSGFSPIIEFEFPTHEGGDQHVNTLVGFSTALANSQVAFNQIIHFDPRNDMLEGSASLVWRLFPKVFPVVEILGEGGRGMSSTFYALGGVKIPVWGNHYLGLGVEAPLTDQQDFSERVLFSFDSEW